MLSVCLNVQFFMTLHPSTFSFLQHSCHNTIFDRIQSVTATPAMYCLNNPALLFWYGGKFVHQSERVREKTSYFCLEPSSSTFSSLDAFFLFHLPGHEEWLASLPFLSCNHLAVSSHSCDDVARALFLPKTPEWCASDNSAKKTLVSLDSKPSKFWVKQSQSLNSIDIFNIEVRNLNFRAFLIFFKNFKKVPENSNWSKLWVYIFMT